MSRLNCLTDLVKGDGERRLGKMLLWKGLSVISGSREKSVLKGTFQL